MEGPPEKGETTSLRSPFAIKGLKVVSKSVAFNTPKGMVLTSSDTKANSASVFADGLLWLPS